MCPLELIGNRTHEVPDGFLLVGIDDTGHEDLLPGHPTFGLGGCAIPARHYAGFVREPWLSLRKEHFSQLSGPMHAADLREPTIDQVTALGSFCRSYQFARIAVVISIETVRDSSIPPYELIARLVLERIGRLAAHFGCDGVAMIAEESERGDRLAAAYFEGYDSTVTQGPFMKFRMPKQQCEPLLEVSDFIIHTAASQVRSLYKGIDWNARRDFKAIFRSVDPALCRFLDLTKATFSTAGA